jgi:hypothetical protein
MHQASKAHSKRHLLIPIIIDLPMSRKIKTSNERDMCQIFAFSPSRYFSPLCAIFFFLNYKHGE